MIAIFNNLMMGAKVLVNLDAMLVACLLLCLKLLTSSIKACKKDHARIETSDKSICFCAIVLPWVISAGWYSDAVTLGNGHNDIILPLDAI